MKITSCFTHPQPILGVNDFLLSDEHNQSYNKMYLGSSKFYNGSEREGDFEAQTSPSTNHKND